MGLEQHPSFPQMVTDDHPYTLVQMANGTFDNDKFSAELKASGITQMPRSMGISATAVTFRFGLPLSGPDKALLDAAVAAHTGKGTLLELAKKAKVVAIDQRTAGLIATGSFTYGGKQLSMSSQAQFNTHVMYTRKDQPSFIYPVVRATQDNTDSVSLPDAAAVEAFYAASETAVRALLDAGNVLKTQVNAAISVADVNAIVDNR